MDLKLRENQIGLIAAITFVLFLFTNVVVVKMPISGWSALFDLPFGWNTIFSLLLLLGLLVVVFMSSIPALDSCKQNSAVSGYCSGTQSALIRLVAVCAGLPFYLFWLVAWDKMVRLSGMGFVLLIVTLINAYLAYQLYQQKKKEQ